jgi:predicted PurR-regulated permease PerM
MPPTLRRFRNPLSPHRFARPARRRQTAPHRGLIPGAFGERVALQSTSKGINVAARADDRLQARNDLAWAISVGGIGAVGFAALLLFTWHFAATLFLIFAGVLLGVALNAMTDRLGRAVHLPHWLRLAVVCLVLASLLSGAAFLGGATIAQQATALSGTIKSQLASVKTFLEKNGIDTSYLNLGNAGAPSSASTTGAPGAEAAPTHNLPDASTLASSGGAIVSQTLKLLLGTVSAVGNFFIVIFLGLTFAAQPGVYRSGLLFLAPARHRARTTVIVDRTGETLQRWLIAQMITMSVVFLVTWIGLSIIGIPGAFILGIQAGLLTFIPTVGALVGGLIVVLASLASGWAAAASAFVLFLGIHVLESYILTPMLQREALDIPPATLFAFQILLGVVFGIWGLALALPLMAIAKVIIDDFKAGEA